MTPGTTVVKSRYLPGTFRCETEFLDQGPKKDPMSEDPRRMEEQGEESRILRRDEKFQRHVQVVVQTTPRSESTAVDIKSRTAVATCSRTSRTWRIAEVESRHGLPKAAFHAFNLARHLLRKRWQRSKRGHTQMCQDNLPTLRLLRPTHSSHMRIIFPKLSAHDTGLLPSSPPTIRHRHPTQTQMHGTTEADKHTVRTPHWKTGP